MKAKMMIAAFLAGSLSAHVGTAKDLGDILLEKGLITADELKQAREEEQQKTAAEESRRDAIAAKLPKWLEVITPFGDIRVREPAGLFGDVAYNTLADGHNTGLYVGVGVGKAGKDWYRDTLKNQGDWGLSYTYAWVEKDAVLSIFSFSDINEFSTAPAKAGSSRPTQKGGTNLMAHIPRFDYVLLPNLQLTAKAYIENVLDRKLSNAALTGNPTLVRMQLDA